VRLGEAIAAVRRVRAALATIIVVQGLLAGAAVGVLVASVRGGEVVAVAVGLLAAAGVVWRSRAVFSLEGAALWVEERDRALQYALVTAVDPRYRGHRAPAYEGALLRRAALRAIGSALGALVLAIGIRTLAITHRGMRFDRARAATAPGRERPVSRLTPLVAHVAPPAYSHVPGRDVREPTSIASLVGTMVTLRGPGDTAGLRASVGARALSVVADGDTHWQAAVSMPATATVVRLSDRGTDRLVVLSPIPDAPPTVELVAPARDSTMRAAHGTVPLVARASDDIGLADGYFEVIVSAGEEETGGVQGHTFTIARTSFHDVRSASLGGGLALDSLRLNPGDVVSIRAVARDGNTVSGPGVGTSDTRTLRVATKEEYDSIAVEGAPPPGADSSYMSQRLIVLATQDLLRRMGRRPPVARDTVVKFARRLGEREQRLKDKVYTLLYGGDQGGGEAMPVAERVLFDTAYHAMNDASMSLAIAEARGALPRELVALAALDSVRKMQHRLYLRGQPPTIVVNTARVRMTGTERPDAGPRTPAVPTDSVSRRLARQLAVIGRLPVVAIGDSLALMQVAAYGVSPALAAALGDAATATRGGQDPTPAMARARRMLAGPVRVDTGRTAWVSP